MAGGCRHPELPRLEGDALTDGAPQIASCMGLATTCGLDENESCCRTEAVTGGMFFRSYDQTAAYPSMGSPAIVSSFVLDAYEVTVGRFRAFVDAGFGTRASPPAAGAGAHPRLPGSGWDEAWNSSLAMDRAGLMVGLKCQSSFQTWTDSPGGNERHAMSCVTWYEAMAFCIWDGGYLPTEAEWNYAASGGAEQRVYPWSNPATSTAIDCRYASYRPGMYCVSDPTGAVSQVGSASPKGAGRWQHWDLAGNVYEWTLDWYGAGYPVPCDDCANLDPATSRVIRGGAFDLDASALRTSFRFNVIPSGRDPSVGFRCARRAP
jgi:formylglycine-generating enzyme